MSPHSLTSTDTTDGSDVAATAVDSDASVNTHQAGRLLVFDRPLDGGAPGRDPARGRRDGFDHFTLRLLRSGRFDGDALGEALGDAPRLKPGEVVLFDRARPPRIRADDTRFVTVSISRELVERVAPNARRHHGQPLPACVSGLLGDFMVSLARRAATLGPEAAAGAARALAELLAGALAQVETRGDASAAALTDQRLERARTCIDQRLSDPRLDAGTIAAAAGLSRSVLYRLFAPMGGVAQFILARRVAALAASLRDPAETRSITALTYDHGFSSESHCSRAFRAVHGQPPGRFRTAMRRDLCGARPTTGGVVVAWPRALA